MSRSRKFPTRSIIVLAAIVLFSLRIEREVYAGAAEQVCDVDADYALGAEDYAEAIRLHREVVRTNPDDALAHYHLGFAEGMIGNRVAEIAEYRRAEELGLRLWDLFLDLGLAQLESGDQDAAAESLRKAVSFGEEHSESHFNLALVDEMQGNLAEAEQETLTSLRLSPVQPDARNELGVIYAEEGKSTLASQVWLALIREQPGYRPARQNLAILSHLSGVAGLVLPEPPTKNAFPTMDRECDGAGSVGLTSEVEARRP